MVKKYILSSLVAAFAAIDTAQAASIINTNNATQLVNILLGSQSGITIVGTPILTGNSAQFGTFTEGNIGTGIGIDEGIILSSGKVSDAIGRYTLNGSGTSFETSGDSDLNQLIPGFQTGDAAILSFDFTTTTDSLYVLNYVFASQEYAEYVGQSYNDVFGYFIDGVNIATVPGTNEAVTVNTINNGPGDNGFDPKNSQYYISNRNNNRNLIYGGLTTPLSGSITNLSPGIHNFKIAIADASDTSFDSAVFLARNSISSTPTYGAGTVNTAAVPEPFSILGTIVAGGAAYALKKRYKVENKLNSQSE